jgi:hypothetical protein
MGSASDVSNGDANVSGTIATNAGAVQPGVGEEVNVTLLNSNAVINAVVVKGANGDNVYSNATVLPPTLLAPQHYISPLTGSGGNVPTISHWFVCYHLTTAPPVGSITVSKVVIGASGLLLSSPPSSYSALVTCTNGTTAEGTATVTFGGGGGVGTPSPALANLPVGTVCTVVEQNPPSNATVTYSPAGVDMTGVVINGTTPVGVTITNSYAADPVETGSLQLVKVVVNPDEVAVPANFTAQVLCGDGTNATVTMPGTGGAGTPIVTPQLDTNCTLEETNLPAGWTVTYSVDGGAASTTPPTFPITSATTTVTVTLTNTAPTTTTSTSTTSTSTTTTSTTTTTTTLPPNTTTSTSTSVPGSTSTAPPSTTGTTTPTTVAPAGSFDPGLTEAAPSGGALAFTGGVVRGPIEAALFGMFLGSLMVAASRWRRRRDG